MNFSTATRPIANAIADTFDAPVEEVLSAYLDYDGNIYGSVLSAGNVYDYAASEDEIYLEHQQDDSNELNEYAAGLMEGMSVHVDSIDGAYEWARGYLRMDAKAAAKCKSGGVPCGSICLPKGKKCRKGVAGKTAGNLRTARTNLRTGGGSGVSRGVAVAAGAAGGLAAAGGAGYLAYRNRENLGEAGAELKRGAKATGKSLKAAGVEGYKNTEQGVQLAKRALKEGADKLKSIKAGLGELPEDMPDKDITGRTMKMGARGATYGAAAGAVGGGLEQGAKAAGKNLKVAGGEAFNTIKRAGKLSFRNRKKASQAA